jgi:hypothetical protein
MFFFAKKYVSPFPFPVVEGPLLELVRWQKAQDWEELSGLTSSRSS